MLVLTRKVGDVIAIGDNIKIVVMAIKGKQVRLGIQADRSTIVHREEVYQKIQQENRAAMNSELDNTRTAQDLFKTVTASNTEAETESTEKRKRPAMKFVKSVSSSDSDDT